MRKFILATILTVFTAGSFVIRAQNSDASSTGTVTGKKQVKSKPKLLDISTIDFTNYAFPEFGDGKPAGSIILKNGASDNADVFPKYTLRKTYYFDLTGDNEDEAISHIIVEGCKLGCEKSNLFYIYTADGKKNEKLLWKIATGGDVMGGLKSANFDVEEIVLDVFGSCTFENHIIKAEVDLNKNSNLKTTNYTRFVFAKSANGYTQTSRLVLPLKTNVDFTEFRPQISFGTPE